MNNQELLNKEPSELKDMLVVSQEKLRDLRFKDSNKQLKNIREIRATRHLIARLLTILNKKK